MLQEFNQSRLLGELYLRKFFFAFANVCVHLSVCACVCICECVCAVQEMTFQQLGIKYRSI